MFPEDWPCCFDDMFVNLFTNPNENENGKSHRSVRWGSGYESKRSRNDPFFRLNPFVKSLPETKEIQKNIARIHNKYKFKKLKDIIQKKFKLERQENRSEVIFFNKLYFYPERYQYLQEYFRVKLQSLKNTKN